MTIRSDNALLAFASKIGSCSICMRQSLLAAGGAWLAHALVGEAFGHIAPLTFTAAILLSALWLVHVATYMTRSIRWARQREGLEMMAAGRRGFLAVAGRAVAVASLASLPAALLPERALAFCGQCTVDSDCGSSDSNWCCKNTAPVNAGHVCNECKKCV